MCCFFKPVARSTQIPCSNLEGYGLRSSALVADSGDGCFSFSPLDIVAVSYFVIHTFFQSLFSILGLYDELRCDCLTGVFLRSNLQYLEGSGILIAQMECIRYWRIFLCFIILPLSFWFFATFFGQNAQFVTLSNILIIAFLQAFFKYYCNYYQSFDIRCRFP